MFEGLENVDLFPMTAADVLVNILVALVCGVVISLIYRRTYRGPGYSVSFANAIILLAMVTAVVMLVIGNNLARAFGLVGAMSIIRFRTAVKETQDIVFIFFSLATGMAAGVGYHMIAIVGTVCIGATLLVLVRSGVTAPGHKEYLLQLAYSGNGDAAATYLPLFKEYCRRYKVINVRSLDEQGLLELSYYVKFEDERQNQEFVQRLRRTDGVRNINLFFDEERV